MISSVEFWDGLPADIRAELEKALAEAIEYGNQVAAAKDQEDKQKIIESKRSEIITLTEAERAQWVEAMKPVWKQFESAVGKENLDAAIASNE